MSATTSGGEPVQAVDADELDELAPVYAAAVRVLGIGFRLSAGLLVAGLIIAAIRREPLSSQADDFQDILPALLDGEARGVIDLAILSMMATPVATVVVVALGFFRAGDRAYARFSLIVLAILAVSISLAIFS